MKTGDEFNWVIGATDAERAYEIYCSIARQALGREPISRERWGAIPQRSYFRTTTLPRHDDAEFDNHKERDGDAQ